MSVARVLLRLYPGWWRARYGPEVEAMLEQDRLGPRTNRRTKFRTNLRTNVDLLRGALDAHLHSGRPPRTIAIAALTGGAIWTTVSLALAGQPVPADWPGYVVEILPLAAIGVACLLVAVCGTWLRLGDRTGVFDRLALVVAFVGHALWFAALVAAVVGITYGAETALAATIAAVGTALVAIALLRAQDWPLAGFVAAAPAGLLIGVPFGWLVFGLAWSAAGLLLLVAPRNGHASDWAG